MIAQRFLNLSLLILLGLPGALLMVPVGLTARLVRRTEMMSDQLH